MKVGVVLIKDCDIDTVFEIQRKAFEPLYQKYHDDKTSPYMESKETLKHKYTREGTIGYVIEKDGITVGAVRICIYPENKSARISALCILPQYQNQGIAQKALLEIENKHRDVRRWFLDTIAEEAANCHLYEKLGYKRSGNTEKVNQNMTLVVYEKTIPVL